MGTLLDMYPLGKLLRELFLAFIASVTTVRLRNSIRNIVSLSSFSGINNDNSQTIL